MHVFGSLVPALPCCALGDWGAADTFVYRRELRSRVVDRTRVVQLQFKDRPACRLPCADWGLCAGEGSCWVAGAKLFRDNQEGAAAGGYFGRGLSAGEGHVMLGGRPQGGKQEDAAAGGYSGRGLFAGEGQRDAGGAARQRGHPAAEPGHRGPGHGRDPAGSPPGQGAPGSPSQLPMCSGDLQCPRRIAL